MSLVEGFRLLICLLDVFFLPEEAQGLGELSQGIGLVSREPGIAFGFKWLFPNTGPRCDGMPLAEWE